MKSTQLSNVCSKCNHTFTTGEGRYLCHDGVYCVACHKTPLRLRRSVPPLATIKLREKVAELPKESSEKVK